MYSGLAAKAITDGQTERQTDEQMHFFAVAKRFLCMCYMLNLRSVSLRLTSLQFELEK